MIDLNGRRLLTLNEAMTKLGMNRTRFYRLRRDDVAFPRPVDIAGKAYFNEADLAEWLDGKLLKADPAKADFRAQAPRQPRTERRASAR